MKTETFSKQATAAGHSNDKRDPFEVLETGFHAFHRPGRNFAEIGLCCPVNRDDN